MSFIRGCGCVYCQFWPAPDLDTNESTRHWELDELLWDDHYARGFVVGTLSSFPRTNMRRVNCLREQLIAESWGLA